MKDHKAQVSIDLVKDVVKRLKQNGIDQLSHHDLAIALTTIGFKQVAKQFGGQWNSQHESQALKKLSSSQYDLSWYGKVNNPHYSPFLQLCLRGDIEKVKQFVLSTGKQGKKQLVSTTDNLKRTALHLAVIQSYDVLAEYLIGEGFSLNARDRELKTPLHYCKSELVCQLLLKKGANVTYKDNKNCTVAHYAAGGQQFKVLQLVLKKINIVNQPDSTLKTPIFYAVYNATEQQINILRILMENGAQINHQQHKGKTPLHYASQLAKTRCIPFLLKKGANPDLRDKHGKTPLDLSSNQKVTRLFQAYQESKGIPSFVEEKLKRKQFSKIAQQNIKQNKNSPIAQQGDSGSKVNHQIFTKQLNQVSTWIREKFFILMKKLQESGIKSMWHLKRPYIYTGSWAQDVDALQDLYESFINVSGAEAAMRTFNILCPYQKALPSVLGKSQQAFQSFFGQNWFSTDPVQKIRNLHSQSKIRSQLQQKMKENEDLQTQLLGYRSQIQKLQGVVIGLKEELGHYSKVQQQLRKERAKNTQQYTQLLKHINEIDSLKSELQRINSGQDKVQTLSTILQELRNKNEDLNKEIYEIKHQQAAARRKCGQLFLKSLSLTKTGEDIIPNSEQNLFDDDAIINLYDLLRANAPNLEKRFKQADKRGTGKLNIQQFTKMLQNLSMLPQDVMSMHRITGFSQGRKTLSLAQFKTLLENRHKNRPMWQKQLVRKIKNIILSSGISLDKFFQIVDVDGSGTIQPAQLRKGLEDCNIFMNQTDWSNLFNLLDADKSGTVELQQLKALFEQQSTGKLAQVDSIIKPRNQVNQNEGEMGGQREQQPAEFEKQPEQQPQKQQQQQKQADEEPLKQQNILLQQEEEEQFKEEYQQQDQDSGIIKLTGVVKAQVPKLSDLALQQEAQECFIRFTIGQLQQIKKVDLSLPKLSIAVKLKMFEYKILDPSQLIMHVSVFKTRTFDEQNYLGEFAVELQPILSAPNTFAVNQEICLQASQYEAEVSGSMVIQAKWIPSEDE